MSVTTVESGIEHCLTALNNLDRPLVFEAQVEVNGALLDALGSLVGALEKVLPDDDFDGLAALNLGCEAIDNEVFHHEGR